MGNLGVTSQFVPPAKLREGNVFTHMPLEGGGLPLEGGGLPLDRGGLSLEGGVCIQGGSAYRRSACGRYASYWNAFLF